MDAAQAWGTPPWLLAGGPPLKWYLRYTARREAEIRGAKLKQQIDEFING